MAHPKLSRVKLIHWFPWLKGKEPPPPGTYNAKIEDIIELKHVDGSKVIVIELKQVDPTDSKKSLRPSTK